MTDNRLLGALLAGGQSRRFGSDKAVALLRGRTLLERAATELSRHVGDIVLCGREDGNFRCLADHPAGIGPLGGLNAALHHAQAHRFAGVLTTACDIPLFPKELADALTADGPAVLDGLHIVGFWPASLADGLDTFLAGTDRYAVGAWVELSGARRLRLPGIDLPNINSGEELALLERRWVDPPEHDDR